MPIPHYNGPRTQKGAREVDRAVYVFTPPEGDYKSYGRWLKEEDEIRPENGLFFLNEELWRCGRHRKMSNFETPLPSRGNCGVCGMSGPIGEKCKLGHQPCEAGGWRGKEHNDRYQAIMGPQGIIVDARKWSEANCPFINKDQEVESKRRIREASFAIARKARWVSSGDQRWIRFREKFSTGELDLDDVDLGRIFYGGPEVAYLDVPSHKAPRVRSVLGKHGR